MCWVGWGGVDHSYLIHLMLKITIYKKKAESPKVWTFFTSSECILWNPRPGWYYRGEFSRKWWGQVGKALGTYKEDGGGVELVYTFCNMGPQQSVYIQHRALGEPNQCQSLLNNLVPATTKVIQFSDPIHSKLSRNRRRLFVCWLAC